MAHAHSTRLSSERDSQSIRRPLGNGMPMTKPSGISINALSTSLTLKGEPTNLCSTADSPNKYTPSRAITASKAFQTCEGRSSQCRDAKLPAPLESSIRKTTTVMA